MNAIRKPSCAVPECVKKFIDVQHFFKFPKERDRWLQWVRACGRLDLEPKGPEYAHQNCRLCHLHFENKWYKINKVRARLHPNAVPTIFFGPDFQQQDNTAPEQTTQQNKENVVKEKVDRNTCAEATVAEMQVQEDNSKADKAETSQTIVPIIVSDVEITQPSTSTIKKPAVRNKSSDDSPRKRKLREKFQKLKAQNKVMRETIRRLRMKKKKEATKVEEENEFDQLKKLGLLTCLKDEYTNEKLGEEVELVNITFYRFLVYILSIFCSTLLYSNCSLHFYCPFLFLGCIEVDRVAEIQINERIVQ